MKPYQPPLTPPGHVLILGDDEPLTLDCGQTLGPFPLAYKSYGTLNKNRSNVILVAHALTGDQVVAGTHPITGRPGWWDRMVGPGKLLDTDRFFILCVNVPGGCMGSAGPAAINPQTGRVWSTDFPPISIADMVRAQAMLLDRLGIDDLFMAIGGSMGGMQILQWVKDFGKRVFSATALATAGRHSPQQIALHSIGRRAIMADQDWCDGRYHETGRAPTRGLEVARMLAHLTYRSPEELDSRFGRELRTDAANIWTPDPDYQVESYLNYHGSVFTKRFDPASYVLITRALDGFDLAPGGDLVAAFKGTTTRMLLAAYDTDWLYPPEQTHSLAKAMSEAGSDVTYRCYKAVTGHDSFLLDVPEFDADFSHFLEECAVRRGLPGALPVAAPDEAGQQSL